MDVEGDGESAYGWDDAQCHFVLTVFHRLQLAEQPKFKTFLSNL